jgi:tetratricopeptide (TPR) repeat protein
MIRTLAVASVALLFLTCPLRTAAQETPEEQAKKHNDLGLQYVDSGEFASAVEEFRKAYRLTPKAKYLFNIGRAYHVMGKLRLALDHYRRCLDDDPEGKHAPRARELLDELDRQLARLKVLSNVPEATRLEVDGDPALCRVGGSCLLDPGEHNVVVTADGYIPHRNRFRIDAGEERVESVTLILVPPRDLPSRTGVVWRSALFPGMGQYYAGNKGAAVAFMVTESLCLATIAGGAIAQGVYQAQQSAEKDPERYRGFNDYINASYWTWVGGAIAAGLTWGINLGHAAALKLPEAKGPAMSFVIPWTSPDGGGLTWSIAW